MTALKISLEEYANANHGGDRRAAAEAIEGDRYSEIFWEEDPTQPPGLRGYVVTLKG